MTRGQTPPGEDEGGGAGGAGEREPGDQPREAAAVLARADRFRRPAS
jgi:hypothetical protein